MVCGVSELCLFFFFFFSSRRRHTRFDCDWSSDVCSSDLGHGAHGNSHGGRGPPTQVRLRVAHVCSPFGSQCPRRGSKNLFFPKAPPRTPPRFQGFSPHSFGGSVGRPAGILVLPKRFFSMRGIPRAG